MLFDPKWEKPTDVLSLDSLIMWLESIPRDRTYDYGDPMYCLAAQYNAHIGRKYKVVGLFRPPSPDDDFDTLLETIALKGPRTFGAALERTRALRVDTWEYEFE